jgi:hypothetical protein
MRYTFLFSILVLLSLSCSKDKFSSTPSLKFTSVNTTSLRNHQLIQFNLSFTDAAGNLTDSIYVQEVVPNCTLSNFNQLYPLPAFPSSKNQKGDLIVTFGYNVSGYSTISPKCMKNDTAVFRFVLRDKANHASDTASSPPIILYYQ